MINGILGISTAIVRVAILFTRASDKEIFNSYPGVEWGENVDHNIKLFTDISKYIEDSDANYWNVVSTTRRISQVAGILFSNSDLFSKTIDPNYIKNLSKNILDFSDLAKKITESESGLGLGDRLFGTDPIVQVAKRMTTLAEGYDKLANSLMKLGTAMNMLNISDVRTLGGLTRTIINPNEASSIKESLTGESPTMKTGDTSLFESFFKKKDDDVDEIVPTGGTINDKMDTVIELLASINNNTININEFIEEKSGIEAPPDLS